MNLARRIVLLGTVLVTVTLHCVAQQQPPQSNDPVRRATADETFDLNITERRITENDFIASTSVGFESKEANLSVQVGVELRAQKIDVLLRNVTGSVRFRGSIQRILDLINSRPARPPE